MLELAESQHWLLSTSDLSGLGFDTNAIRQLVKEGLLQRVVRGLYRVRGTRSPEQDIAAALRRHVGAVASHCSALFLHGLSDLSPAKPDFTVQVDSTGRTTLGRLHRSHLPTDDVTRVRDLPVTSVQRSVVDAARYLTPERLADLLNVVLSERRIKVAGIVEVARRLETEPGRDGHAALRVAMGPWTDPIQPDTPAEAAVIRRISAAGLPKPVTQHRVFDNTGEFVARVDLAWPDERVVREYDSDRWHGPERAERDELRLQRLESLGWSVDVIARQDLRPSARAWLNQLRRDLVGSGRQAS